MTCLPFPSQWTMSYIRFKPLKPHMIIMVTYTLVFMQSIPQPLCTNWLTPSTVLTQKFWLCSFHAFFGHFAHILRPPPPFTSWPHLGNPVLCTPEIEVHYSSKLPIFIKAHEKDSKNKLLNIVLYILGAHVVEIV